MPQGSDFYQREEMEKKRNAQMKEREIEILRQMVKDLEARVTVLENTKRCPSYIPVEMWNTVL